MPEMMNTLILGSRGMLGQQITRVFSREGISFRVSDGETAPDARFRFNGQEGSELARLLEIRGGEYVVNCVGWIPQKASGLEEQDANAADLVNCGLPEALEGLSRDYGIKVLQVATDCVFSGGGGPYFESSPLDATDIYGTSKINGELRQPSAMRIRSSIIGPDMSSNSGLFSWFRSKPTESTVTGFDNHLWNGVSTLALAKLFSSIIHSGSFAPGLRHWVPSGHVSKFDLLELFHSHLPVTASVTKGHGHSSADRRLATNDLQANRELWRLAGYQNVPTIPDLVGEMIRDFDENWQSHHLRNLNE